jgi:hypothetical protein
MSNVITPKEGEKVLLNLRKSILTYRKETLRFLLMVVIAALVALFLYMYIVALIFAAALLFIALIYAFYHFLIWFYDVYIITNMRLVSVSKKGLFTREFSEVDYNDVTDITYRISGVFATIFQYGTVTVKGPSIIELTNLADPSEILEMLKSLVETTKKRLKNNVANVPK